jgi:hypothetical protein
MIPKEEGDRGDGNKPSSQGGQTTAVIVCLWISNFKKLVVSMNNFTRMSPMDAEVRVYPTDVPRRAKQETNNNF